MSEYNPNAPQAQQVSADLFGDERPADPTSIVGLRVQMPTPCLMCTDNFATIGPGKKPHAASLRCTSCMRFRGWMSLRRFQSLLCAYANGQRR